MTLGQSLKKWFPLFLITSLGLFIELAVVRWLSGEVRLFSYFKNLPMLAAFLGLAVGYALAGQERDYLGVFAPLLALLVALVIALGRVVSPRALAYPGSGDDFLWAVADFSYWTSLILFLGVVLVVFLSTMFLFIPLGQAAGNEMAHHSPVPAYIVNLIASLAGVWAFALFSYLRTPPVIWFGFALLGVGFYLYTRQSLTLLALVIFVAVLVGQFFTGRGVTWSPYQRLEVHDMTVDRESDGKPVKVGYILKVQQAFHQFALDLSPEFLAELNGESPRVDYAAFSYNLPYDLGANRGEVLIVGAGMGNDVAAALRSGAQRIDAVEIDPAILALGRELHPERPYDDERVNAIVDDARSFFEKNTKRYDMVAFGLLDSHTLLSGMTSVRLDSFVYTLESFEQVKRHLADDGMVALTFDTSDKAPWIEERLGRMLGEVFGTDKLYYHKGATGTAFLIGEIAPEHLEGGIIAPWKPSSEQAPPLTTDDWPYLYMRARKVPSAYWQAILLISVACLALFARTFPQALRPNWHFWLLGAAFLLVEFKSITEFALLFGTTWLVNALAITGVLAMSLAANLIVLWRKRVRLWVAYALLFASLALAYLIPLNRLVGLPLVVRLIASIVLLSLPMFFAGLIFSESLRRTGNAAQALASNLSGSFVGGILEYGSLMWGIKSLYVIAAVVYLGALITSRIRSD